MLNQTEPGYKNLDPDEVREKLERGDEVFLVDVREPRQFHKGHIPDAILLPAADFAERYDREIDPEDEVILVCERGETSAAAAKYLVLQGFSNVATMAGGMAAWDGPLTGIA